MGNFSRETFDQLKHYVGVRLQQGVPLVDADWNELEDIRKYELQAFLKWYVGDGVPAGNNGFRITVIGGVANDFVITGGDGTASGAGRCLVDGWDVINESDINYTAQSLFNNTDLASAWGVDVLPALNVPGGLRQDLVYLDVWEREVDSNEDSDLINPAIGLETAVRLKREWVVRVNENAASPPVAPAGHTFYPLARLQRNGVNLTAVDLRDTGITLSALEAEIADARGIKANLGNRLDESLTSGGQLRHNTVGHDQFKSEVTNRLDNALTPSGDLQPNVVSNSNVDASAAINESKILFSSSGHDHSGGSEGNTIDTNGLQDEAVTIEKIKFDIVEQGSVTNLAPGDSEDVLVEENLEYTDIKKKFYMPTIGIEDVSGSGQAQITWEMVYKRWDDEDTTDVFLRISNDSGGSEEVDIIWTVMVIGQEA